MTSLTKNTIWTFAGMLTWRTLSASTLTSSAWAATRGRSRSRPGWGRAGNTTSTSTTAGWRPRGRPARPDGGWRVLRSEGSYCQCQVSQPVWSPAQETDKEFVEVSRHPLSVWTLRQVWWLRLDSVQYGLAGYLVRVWVCLMQINVGSDGTQITLSQSDKWLRQAKVIDGWSVTTTDTAIAFRWLLLSTTHWLSNAKLMNYVIIPFI